MKIAFFSSQNHSALIKNVTYCNINLLYVILDTKVLHLMKNINSLFKSKRVLLRAKWTS